MSSLRLHLPSLLHWFTAWSSSLTKLPKMSTYKLSYFNFRGRAEVPRLLLIKNGVKFEDIRVEFYTEEWPNFKAKTSLPFGQLPILEVDGKVLFQSFCISRFLGKRFGMYGSNEFEECKIGAVHLTMEDMVRMALDWAFDVENEEEKATIRERFLKKLPEFLTSLENMVEDKGFFVGDSMTVADLAFFVYSDFNFLVEGVKVDWDDYPKLKGVLDKVKSDPKIAEWVKTRPQTIV